MRRLLLPVVVLLCSALLAQDDVLPVEKRSDLGARNRLAVALADIRLDFTVNEVTPKALCRYLSSVTGDEVNFLFLDRDGAAADIEPISLRLKSATVLQAMRAVQTVTGLRFVYRSGVVFLMPKDNVKPLTHLVMYDLRGPTRLIRNFPGPKIGLNFGEEQFLFPEEEEPTTTVSGFTAENVEEMLRAHVTPEAWDSDGVSMSNADGLFLIRHTLEGHRQIRDILVRMGVLTQQRVIVRRAPERLPLRVLRRPR